MTATTERAASAPRPPWAASVAGLKATARRLQLLWPLALVAIVLGSLVVGHLDAVRGKPAGFIVFGRDFTRFTDPPAGAPIASPAGYDGQWYWRQAHDPLLLDQSTIDDIHNGFGGYQLERFAYPALAYVLAGGQPGALAWSMIAINVLAIMAITVAFAVYARGREWAPVWTCVVGLTPGLLMPALRDLTDVLATTCLFGGLLLWRLDRRWATGVVLAIAALAREPMALGAVAVAVDLMARCWGERAEPRQVRRLLAETWPAVAIPAVTFLGWQAYIHSLNAPSAGLVAQEVPLFSGFSAEFHRAVTALPPVAAGWEVAYLTLTLLGMATSLVLVRRGLGAPAVAAALLSMTLPVIALPDQWSLTRYVAPMFLALLLAGLERRSRFAVGLCAVGSAMSLLLPLGIGIT